MKKNQSFKSKGGSHAGSTQKFTEILDISEEIAIFTNGNACLIIEVQASNFSLLSEEEKEVKILSYAGMLNSLSFPIQIVVRNKRIDISSYVKLLEDEAKKTIVRFPTLTPEQNKSIATYIKHYKEFVQELVTVNTVLDKKFYIVISFSYLEAGVSGAKSIAKTDLSHDQNFISAAKANLKSKADTIHNQLARINLRAKTLEKEELIKLYYSIYNETQPSSKEFASGVKTTIIRSSKDL